MMKSKMNVTTQYGRISREQETIYALIGPWISRIGVMITVVMMDVKPAAIRSGATTEKTISRPWPAKRE